MNERDATELATFEREADLRFRNSRGEPYDEAVEETKDLVEQYSNAGIAAGGKFSRKAANLVIERFKSLRPIIEEAYIRALERRPDGITGPRETWLRAKLERVATEEIRRAQLVLEQCCAGFGSFAQVSVHVARLQGEGDVLKRRLEDTIALAVLDRKSRDAPPEVSTDSAARVQTPLPASPLLIFISHSSRDAELAVALIDLLKSSLGLVADQIRCSSVDGYRLPVGVNTENQLREEVKAAKVVIGLITPSSLRSDFVMFELGARWGANLCLAPLLAGVKMGDLSAPLSLLNALSAENDSQIHQLLQDISAYLGLRLQSAASYVRHVANVKGLASTMTEAEAPPPAVAAKTPSEGRISLSAEGTPPSQIIKVLANRAIAVCRLEYMMSDETCIVGEDIWLEGQTIDVPLNYDAMRKLWNTPRPDMSHYDHSGPAKLTLTISEDGSFRPLVLPIRMEDTMLGNTSYCKVIGSKTYFGR